MDIGKVGSSGRLPGTAAALRNEGANAPHPSQESARGDRVDLSSEGQLARRALDALKGLMSTDTVLDPGRIEAIRARLESGYYDHPGIRQEIADRLSGLVDPGTP